jgi:hypothetical protein
MTKERGGKSQKCPKATFDILMAKYKEGKTDIRGHENQTIQNPKLDSPVSLSQASTSTARSSSSKRSQTPQQQNLEGHDRRHQDYHLAPYFLVRPPMPGRGDLR